MLVQALLNLAVNSRDAMPQGGRLVVRAPAELIDESAERQNPEAAAGHFVCLSVAYRTAELARAVRECLKAHHPRK